MNFDEKLMGIAEYAGCSDELVNYDKIIDAINKSRLRNIAVMGETNCGKTTLINKLAGSEVKKATSMSMNEPPMMVTFGSDETKEGFEKHIVSNQKCADMGLALYEIPINDAIEYETGKMTSLLEQMDTVIYVISALVPLSASDMRNLDILASRFPVIIYVSKINNVPNEEYGEVKDFITSSVREKYEGVVFGIYESTQEGIENEIIDAIGQFEIDELREFHTMLVQKLAKEEIEKKLSAKKTELGSRREARMQEQRSNDTANRDKELEWNDIRVSMVEKKNQLMERIKKEINAQKKATVSAALSAMKKSGDSTEWVKNGLENFLKEKVNESGISVMQTAVTNADTDTAWLINEVYVKFDIKLEIQDMKGESIHIEGEVGSYDDTRSYKKIICAVGSGLVAGGAILSSMPMLLKVVVTLPATIMMLSFAKGSIDYNALYDEKLEEYVKTCCDKTFAKLIKRVEDHVNTYYGKLVTEIVKLCDSSMISVDFSDIDNMEKELEEKIAELNAL